MGAKAPHRHQHNQYQHLPKTSNHMRLTYLDGVTSLFFQDYEAPSTFYISLPRVRWICGSMEKKVEVEKRGWLGSFHFEPQAIISTS